MKSPYLRFAILAVASLLSTSASRAQSAPSSLLNEVELRQLIIHAEPADHARLSAHFRTLAQRYEAEAKRHDVMGQSSWGTEKLAYLAASQREHCRQLSTRNLKSAAILHELADHHTRLAAGASSALPKGGGAFEAGLGAPAPSDEELTSLAAAAKTGTDHRALEDYFAALGARYEQEATRSASYAAAWRSQSPRNPSALLLASHWERLVRQQRAAASEARASAGLHKAQTATTR